MIKLLNFVLLLTILLPVMSCGSSPSSSRKPMSWGHKQDIFVFADDDVWNQNKDLLYKSLERFRFTTVNEKVFQIKYASIDSLEQYYKFNNLLFLASLDANKPVAKYVKEITGESVKKEIDQNSAGIFPKNNLWANDQFVLFVLADSNENLKALHELQANKIFDLFNAKLKRRISKQVFKQKLYPDSEFKKNSWTANIPQIYLKYKSDDKNRFTSYLGRLRNKSDRYFSVYYEEMAENKVTIEWLEEKRRELAWKYYDEDEFSSADIRKEKSTIAKRACVKISGRWQNKKHAVGGAFQTYAFYDGKNQTAFVIDNSVYFPEGYKLASLLELEAMSNSIKIK